MVTILYSIEELAHTHSSHKCLDAIKFQQQVLFCVLFPSCGAPHTQTETHLMHTRHDSRPHCFKLSILYPKMVTQFLQFCYIVRLGALYSSADTSTLPSPTPQPPRAFHQHHSAPPPCSFARACCHRPSYLLHPSGAPHQASSTRTQPDLAPSGRHLRAAAWTRPRVSVPGTGRAAPRWCGYQRHSR